MRVLRAAVGRRALQLVLLVGGLFMLGFLCGEQAHAADGIGALPAKAAGQLVKPPAEPMAKHTATAIPTATATDTDTDTETDTPKGSSPSQLPPSPAPTPSPSRPTTRFSGRLPRTSSGP